MKSPIADAAAFQQMGKAVAGKARSAAIKAVDAIRAWLIPRAREVFDDSARFISLRTPRRAAKTVTIVAKAIKVCMEKPGARCVLGSMTLKKARALFWHGKDGMKAFDTRFALGIAPKGFNNSEFIATFPNGSTVTIAGFETEADVDKARGEPYDFVGLSECKSFPVGLFKELLDEAIIPALMDELGTLMIEGTPGPILDGVFYQATSAEGSSRHVDGADTIAVCRPWGERERPEWKDVRFQWSFHSWPLSENIAKPHLWGEALEQKRRKRWSDQNPIWRREYIGEWVADHSMLVYKYDAARNGWAPQYDNTNPLGLPLGHQWCFGLGCDLGYDKDFAIQVAAWCDDLHAFYQVPALEFSAPGLTVGGIAAAIRTARDLCGQDFEFLVGDRGGLGKMIFATLETDHGISIEPADKQEKVTHVELLNSDLIDGHCFIGLGSRLAQEMSALTWEIPRGCEPEEGKPFVRKHEAEGFAKDNCDAWLYCCTRAQHRFAVARMHLPQAGDTGYAKWQQAEEVRQYLEAQNRVREMDRCDAVLDDPVTWNGTLLH